VKITSVRIKLLRNTDKLKAFAGITFDDCFVVRNLKVIEGLHGYFVAMPNDARREEAMQGNNDTGIRKRFDIAFPTNNETRKMIEEAVLAEYEKALNEAAQNNQTDSFREDSPPDQGERPAINYRDRREDRPLDRGERPTTSYHGRFPRQPQRVYQPRSYRYA